MYLHNRLVHKIGLEAPAQPDVADPFKILCWPNSPLQHPRPLGHINDFTPSLDNLLRLRVHGVANASLHDVHVFVPFLYRFES